MNGGPFRAIGVQRPGVNRFVTFWVILTRRPPIESPRARLPCASRSLAGGGRFYPPDDRRSVADDGTGGFVPLLLGSR